MPFNYLQSFNYQKIYANSWNFKSLFVCLKQGGHYFLSVLSHVLLNLKIWTCVLLFKPPPNVFKFIEGFNIFNKKEQYMLILLGAHVLDWCCEIYFLNIFNV